MRKQIMTIALVLISVVNHAQNFKVKGSKIVIDDQAIALIDNKKALYTISSLDKTPKMTVEVKQVVYDNGAFDYWYEITDAATNKKTEIPYVKSPNGSSFGYEKNLVANLIESPRPLLSAQGINESLLKEMTETGTTKISEELELKKRKITEDYNNAIALYNKDKIAIDGVGNILKNNVLVGKISRRSTKDQIESTHVDYTVFDFNNIKVGEYYQQGGLNPNNNSYLIQELLTIDRKVFKIKLVGYSAAFPLSKDQNAVNIVATLLYNGYELGEQMKGIIQEQRMEDAQQTGKALDEAKSNSKNIYDVSGYLIDEKGQKREGTLNALFEDVTINKNSSNGITDITTYGKTVTLTYTNEKGKSKNESFKSKNGIRFCLNSGECYLGLKTIGNTMATAGSLNSLSFDFSSFYKILYEKDGYMVLVDPVLSSDFIIKIPTQEKGLYTNKSSNDKLKKNVIEYLKCDSFVFENYNFKTLEGLIKVLGDYENNCSK
ncbi:hypothetical protein Flavo103_39720 [Flavobacterium collinsii]|uniref:hypothetical protein n=1 Tax=Flavobacterium collinsii TaxID=1114861 RepID=UPI0022BCDEAF|nr:hypothetical protein [Flavobacterium collinsii]GIQ60836.1 hypothetical protein Flavo103_39720 [Flavobacterium collinsii]